jgi:hypothetical protein
MRQVAPCAVQRAGLDVTIVVHERNGDHPSGCDRQPNERAEGRSGRQRVGANDERQRDGERPHPHVAYVGFERPSNGQARDGGPLGSVAACERTDSAL